MCVQLGFLVLRMMTEKKRGKFQIQYLSIAKCILRRMLLNKSRNFRCCGYRRTSKFSFGSEQILAFSSSRSFFCFVSLLDMELHTEHTYSHRFSTRNESLCIFMCTCRTSQFTYTPGGRSDKEFVPKVSRNITETPLMAKTNRNRIPLNAKIIQSASSDA